jgi:hypothetical protein
VYLAAAENEYLRELYRKNREKAENFSSTASCGKLYIDSVHCMLCFSEKAVKGEPAHFSDIFYISELLELGLYCSDVRNIGTNTNRVVCNVKLKVKTQETCREYTILKDEPCSYKVKNGYLEWEEPCKVSMFRSMMNQMIADVTAGFTKKLNRIWELRGTIDKTMQDIDAEWARGILFLDNKPCAPEEIKSHQRKMTRLFHPDLHPEIDSEYMQKINRAYEILKP